VGVLSSGPSTLHRGLRELRTLYRVASMGKRIRITLETLSVLKVLLDRPSTHHYGLEIAKQAGLPTGTIYPILARLEQAGWVTSEWETIDPAAAGRPRRRFYQLTPTGCERAHGELRQAERRVVLREARPSAPAPRRTPA
jgi:PadR family transcriptional regulator PadR